MEAKHTKKHWAWKQSGDGSYESLVVSGTLHDYVLCPEMELGDYGLSSKVWVEVSDDHARLIAAVPCMYDYIALQAKSGDEAAIKLMERIGGS